MAPPARSDGHAAAAAARVLVGHEADVTDLDWSGAAGFLLSASVDNTVRLWHPSRDACVQVFALRGRSSERQLPPVLPDVFCSGGRQEDPRVGHPEEGGAPLGGRVALITSVAFSPDGGYVAAGLFQGQVFFYHTEGLRYHTQIECRNRRGKFKAGRKVTGLQFMPEERDLDAFGGGGGGGAGGAGAAGGAAAPAAGASGGRGRADARRARSTAAPAAGAAAAAPPGGGARGRRACSSRRTTRACACTGSTTSR